MPFFDLSCTGSFFSSSSCSFNFFSLNSFKAEYAGIESNLSFLKSSKSVLISSTFMPVSFAISSSLPSKFTGPPSGLDIFQIKSQRSSRWCLSNSLIFVGIKQMSD